MLRRQAIKLIGLGGAALQLAPFLKDAKLPSKLNLGCQYLYGRVSMPGPAFSKNADLEKVKTILLWELDAMAMDMEDAIQRYYETYWSTEYLPPAKINPYFQKSKAEVLPGAVGVTGSLPEQAYTVSAYPVASGIMEHDSTIWHRSEDKDVQTVTFFLYVNVVEGFHPNALLPAHIPAWIDTQKDLVVESVRRSSR